MYSAIHVEINGIVEALEKVGDDKERCSVFCHYSKVTVTVVHLPRVPNEGQICWQCKYQKGHGNSYQQKGHSLLLDA